METDEDEEEAIYGLIEFIKRLHQEDAMRGSSLGSINGMKQDNQPTENQMLSTDVSIEVLRIYYIYYYII